MKKLICFCILLSSLVHSQAQSQPGEFENIYRPHNYYSILSLLHREKDPYQIRSLEIPGHDWSIAANYDFRKFRQLEFVYIRCTLADLPPILEKLSEIPFLRKLVLTQYPLFPKTGPVNDSLVFPSGLSKLKTLEGIKFELPKYYNWNSLVSQLSTLPSLKHLSIRGAIAENLDSSLRKLSNLVSLELSGGTLSQFPTWIKEFRDLQFLDISDNEKLDYTDAVKTLVKIPSLRILKINRARFDSFPASFANMQELESLHANSFYAKNMDDFFKVLGRLKKLRWLNLDSGDSISLPPSIGLLSGLEHLSLNYRKLTSLPPEIGNLKALQYLSLYYNGLTNIPATVSNLKKLETFKLSHNKIELIPAEIGHLSSLRSLDLNSNKLKSLPPTIGDLVQLENLDFSQNQLEIFPQGLINCKNLVSLSISINKINELPADFGNLGNLETFTAIGNQIEAIPESIGKLRKLRQLNLDFNQIDSLPKSFTLLTNLRHLTLNNNRLTSLPENFGNLVYLNELNISSNPPIRNSKTSAEPGAELHMNRLNGLPASFKTLDSLKFLRLSNSIVENGNTAFELVQQLKGPVERVQMENCSISELPETGWEKSRILYLDLSRNAISKFPVNILSAPVLQFLYLSENMLQPAFNRGWNGKLSMTLTTIDEKLVGPEAITKYDSISCKDILEAGSYHYFRNKFDKLISYYEIASKNCKDIQSSQWWKKDMYGVSLFQVDRYQEAIPYLAEYLKKDTVGSIRVMNFISPVFDALAKSHLALKDTNSAILVYRKWADQFYDRTAATELALLFLHKKDKVAADSWFNKAITWYKREGIRQPLSAMSQLEIYVMQNKPGLVYDFLTGTDTTKYSKPERMLLEYLLVSHEVSNNNMTEEESIDFIRTVNAMEGSYMGWNYSLFRSWIKMFADNPAITRRLNLLTDTMEKKFH